MGKELVKFSKEFSNHKKKNGQKRKLGQISWDYQMKPKIYKYNEQISFMFHHCTMCGARQNVFHYVKCEHKSSKVIKIFVQYSKQLGIYISNV